MYAYVLATKSTACSAAVLRAFSASDSACRSSINMMMLVRASAEAERLPPSSSACSMSSSTCGAAPLSCLEMCSPRPSHVVELAGPSQVLTPVFFRRVDCGQLRHHHPCVGTLEGLEQAVRFQSLVRGPLLLRAVNCKERRWPAELAHARCIEGKCASGRGRGAQRRLGGCSQRRQ